MTWFRWVVPVVALAALAVGSYWYASGPFEAQAQQETGTCPNARLIDEFRGTGSQTTDTFQTTTSSFRVRWEVDEGATTDPNLAPALFITVNDEENRPVDNASHDGGGSGETFVNEPPGTYSLDIDFIGGQGASYVITIEQCEGGTPSTNSKTEQPKDQPRGQPKTQPSPPPRPSPPPSPTPRPQPAPAPQFKAGGPQDGGPVPLMPNGNCPKEFPLKQGKACYR